MRGVKSKPVPGGQFYTVGDIVGVCTRSFYPANDYFAFFTPAFILVTLFENICKSLNWEVFASGFVISAKK